MAEDKSDHEPVRQRRSINGNDSSRNAQVATESSQPEVRSSSAIVTVPSAGTVSGSSAADSHDQSTTASPTNTSQRIRFSTDVKRDAPAASDTLHGGKARPAVTIATKTPPILDGPIIKSPTSMSPTSPTSPGVGPSSIPARMASRTRDRGYSLRRTLFSRNLKEEAHEEGTVIELTPSPSSRPDPEVNSTDTTSEKEKRRSLITVSPTLGEDDLSSHPTVSKGVIELPLRNRRHHNWLERQLQRSGMQAEVGNFYERARKFVLRIKELPPSASGRHIDLGSSWTEQLIDERTGQPYISNSIRSSRYTPLNFLPRQLFAQFSRLANFYFLCVSILQMIPGLSTTGTYTTIVPLLIFVSISMAREGYDDLRRARLDKEENTRVSKILKTHSLSFDTQADGADPESDTWVQTKWQDIKVGDIVKLERNQAAPADLMLLWTKADNHVAYVETMALDGETNLKSKQALQATSSKCSTAAGTASCHAQIVVEDPNLDLYNFEGKVTVDGKTLPLTNSEVVYRGSVLRNTPEALGVVIYTGEECKIRMNANKNPRIKAPQLQSLVNQIVVLIVILVLTLSIFLTIAYQIWANKTETKSWYLRHAHVAFGQVLVSFIIMFNTMIPLSLYVSLEIVKVFQMLLLNDIDMYDEASNTPIEPRTSTINEELGQISYIFSDKTGTLTNNTMKFRKMSVAGTAWLHDKDLREEAEREGGRELLMHKKRSIKGKKAVSRKSNVSAMTHFPRKSADVNLENGSTALQNSAISTKESAYRRSTMKYATSRGGHTEEMIEYIMNRPNTVFAHRARFFLLAMAICHTCIPEKDDNGEISFQAASPDESALVNAAKELGYLVVDRKAHSLTIRTTLGGSNVEPKYETYQILNVIEFSSARKRMSIIVRMPDRSICVFCKGADTTLMKLLRLKDLASSKASEIERRASQRKSMEVNEVMRRRSEALSRKDSIARSSLSLGRTSLGLPPPVRSSTVESARKQTMRQSIDHWLKERETDVDMAHPRDSAQFYTPRPSAQFNSPRTSANYGGRISLSRLDARNSFQMDEAEELVEEGLVVNDALVFERCFQHINDFASEGLRTLLYGHRYVTEDDYSVWHKLYLDATTSLTDRQTKIENAADIIETQFELTGATAIEDKLQRGVPETIDKLRRANIKLWMLTGDKRETAINIGHSCRLIKDYSDVIILDHELGSLDQRITNAIVMLRSSAVAHSVIVIDGATLGIIQAEAPVFDLFIELAIQANSVICCRASPSQKAALVKTIRQRVKQSVTLAIGDGANDIAMIQEAHVGIGITGKEGLQAARVSDYSIAQFRFLLKLLLVHGRWNYNRVCKYTLGTFWKEMLFYLTQAVYQRYTGYTATSLYESWSLSMFNTLFTSLPVIFMGIFEKDLAASTLLAVPELYASFGQANAGFNVRRYLFWACMAAAEAVIVFFIMYGIYGRAIFTRDQGLYAMGTLTFTACIILINTKMQILEMHNKSVTAAIAFILSVGGWFLWDILLSVTYSDNVIYDVKDGILETFGRNLAWWLVLLITLASTVLLELGIRAVQATISPTDVEIFQALEKDLEVKKRFEEASADELRMGWDRGAKKSSFEILRDEEAARERERQVEELLARRHHDDMSQPDAGGEEVEVRVGHAMRNRPTSSGRELEDFATLEGGGHQFRRRQSAPDDQHGPDFGSRSAAGSSRQKATNTTTTTVTTANDGSSEAIGGKDGGSGIGAVQQQQQQQQQQQRKSLDIAELFAKGFGAVKK